MADKTKFIFIQPKEGTPRLVTWPCTISEPVDGGARRELAIDVRFRLLDGPAIQQAFMGGDLGLYDAVVDGFPGMPIEGGASLDDAVIKAGIAKQTYAVKGILNGFFEMLGGRLIKN